MTKEKNTGAAPAGVPQLLNIHQAAKLTGYSVQYIYKLVGSGVLRASKPFGNTLVFNRAELFEDMARNGEKAGT